MNSGTPVHRKDNPSMTGVILRPVDDDTVLVQWDQPLPFVSGDTRKPVTLIAGDLLEVVERP